MATRVSHRVDFGDLLRILPLAHGRVIVRQLLHALGAQLVETAVADVPDGQAPVVDDGERDDARHARQLAGSAGAAEDLVVRERDGLAHTFRQACRADAPVAGG